MILYSMDGCPYAQRTRALLRRLEQPVELRTIDPKAKPPDFLAVSPNGKVPLLIDGELKLYESAVTIQYLAEKLAWPDAFSPDVGQRARERLAMQQFDEVIVTEHFTAAKAKALPAEPRLTTLRNALAEMERTVQVTKSVDNLLGLHCAPHWLRMRWLEEDRSAPVVGVIREYGALYEWLDASIRLPAIVATEPDREHFLRAMGAFLAR